MAGELLAEFLDFCKPYLVGSQAVGKLIKRKFEDCEDKFKNSPEFRGLVDLTRTKIKDDNARVFVHIKDFVTELKAYGKECSDKEGSSKSKSKNKKRNRDSSPSEDSDVPRKKANIGKELSNEKDEHAIVFCESKPYSSPCNPEVTSTCSPVISPVTKPKPSSIPSLNSNGENCNEVDFCNSEVAEVTLQTVDEEDSKASKQTAETRTGSCASLTEEEKGACSPLLASVGLVAKRVNLQPAKSEDVPAFSPDCRKTEDSSKPVDTSQTEEGPSSSFLGERKDAVNEKHIRRLETLLKKIRNKIEKLKQRELSLDDLEKEDSSYIYEDRLQRKFVKVWDKLCELKGRRKTTGRPLEQRFRYEGTRYPEINKKIEKFINKEKMFPDYHDIRDIFIKVNKRKQLNLSSKMLEAISRDTFTDVGNRLQERRKEDFNATFGCSLTDSANIHDDPAISDPDLKAKLESNHAKGKKNLEMVLSKFAFVEDSERDKSTEDQSAEAKREQSCSPTNEEEEEPEEEVCVPELDEALSISEDEGDDVDRCIEIKQFDDDNDDVCDDEDDAIIEISTDEEEDDAQSDDGEADPSLPKTFASVLESMERPAGSDSESRDTNYSAIIIDDDSMDNGEGNKDDDDEPVMITGTEETDVYVDVATDADVPDVSKPFSANAIKSESENGDSENSNDQILQRPPRSPARSRNSSKLAIRTPQKSLIRKALGLKSPNKGPEKVKFPNQKSPAENSADNSDSSSSAVEISSSVPSQEPEIPTENITEMKSSSDDDDDDVIALSSESGSAPSEDAIITSSTGEPGKWHNSSSDDDIIVLSD